MNSRGKRNELNKGGTFRLSDKFGHLRLGFQTEVLLIETRLEGKTEVRLLRNGVIVDGEHINERREVDNFPGFDGLFALEGGDIGALLVEEGLTLLDDEDDAGPFVS
jgi:hypothetical protein